MIVDSRHGKRRAIKEGAVNHPTAEDANELILNNSHVDANNELEKENSLAESTLSSSLANKDENDQVLTPGELKTLNSGQKRSEVEMSGLSGNKTYYVK
ncbi:hypothetical protein T459_09774 [Capsicum annuum]|uniref:Uncharacterized protein n=1 Tax=Capsicum annuum TaxID=4072 RepID=A0A2G3A0C5_CAPAN|nr:hypothetical protein T459_09774 [Capsicum annuum]